MFDFKKAGIISSACICKGWRGRHQFFPTMEVFNKNGRRSIDCARLHTLTIIRDKILWKAYNYGVNWHQIKLSIEILCYSNIWRSICTASSVLLPCWHNYHSIALIFDTIPGTIDFIYLQLHSGNRQFGRSKSISNRTMTYSLSYDISCVCIFQC